MNNCPDCMQDEDGVGEGVRCLAHQRLFEAMNAGYAQGVENTEARAIKRIDELTAEAKELRAKLANVWLRLGSITGDLDQYLNGSEKVPATSPGAWHRDCPACFSTADVKRHGCYIPAEHAWHCEPIGPNACDCKPTEAK